ncbi:IclR family transcriptional regulator [Plantactinospora siamensis]|uniref:IclR family transcriptional regulator n=1 Tax=Plantactinospora siamensis TaxID=555372 RepID=A0ABV6P4U6_9ACTN
MHRAMTVIELLAGGPRRLTEVADHLGVHKSTALRLLRTLQAGDFARRRPDGAWAVGLGLLGIAQLTLDSLDVRPVARDRLEWLGRRCGHTVHLGQLVDGEVVYVDKVEARSPVRMHSRIGRTAPAHATGIGKVILAYRPEPARSALLARHELRPFTPATISDPARLRADLAAVAERGWAEDDGEFEALVNCVAAPVRGADGTVRAAVSVTAPKVVATLADLRHVVPDLLTTADGISRDLGWSGP